jgi:hypothetical protein
VASFYGLALIVAAPVAWQVDEAKAVLFIKELAAFMRGESGVEHYRQCLRD